MVELSIPENYYLCINAVKMDIEIKKKHFLKEFLSVNNEKVIDKLRLLLKKEKEKLLYHEIKPISQSEFNRLIDKAEEDSANNKVVDARDLKKQVQSWT